MKQRRPFSKVIRALRLERGYTQEELAHVAGIDRSYMGLLERGERNPTLITVFTLAKALRVRASEIVSRMEK